MQEAAVALALAKDESERLRKALLDAEIDLQVGQQAGVRLVTNVC